MIFLILLMSLIAPQFPRFEEIPLFRKLSTPKKGSLSCACSQTLRTCFHLDRREFQ